jgi:hypothetical protein
MKKSSKKVTEAWKAAEAWVAQFTQIPGSVIDEMVRGDDTMRHRACIFIRPIAGPEVFCDCCWFPWFPDEGDLPVDEPPECKTCGYDAGWTEFESSDFLRARCKLFALPRPFHPWFLKSKDAVATFGFFLLWSKDYGLLLGALDPETDGEFDIYRSWWLPLYELWSRQAAR